MSKELKMEEISKNSHKLLLIVLKYCPFIIAICYFVCLIFGCFRIQLFVLPNLIYISPMSGVLILLMSKVLKFCIWHRLPIYYCFCIDVLSTIDYIFNISLSDINMIVIYSLISIVFVIIGMYLKEVYNRKRKRNYPNKQ